MSSVVSLDPFEELRLEIEEVAADDSQDPETRTARLQEWRGDLMDLVGSIDSYVADNRREQGLDVEPSSSEVQEAVLRLRENAEVREELLGRGLADEATLDDALLYSHEELDRLAEEGLLEETALHVSTFAALGEKWAEEKHPRGRGGKFARVFGKITKLKGGESADLGQGVSAKRVEGKIHVAHQGRVVSKHTNPESAARAATALQEKPPTPAPSETQRPADWIRQRADHPVSPEAAAATAAETAQRAAEQGLSPDEKKALYTQRKTDLEKRAAASVAAASATGKLTSAEAHFNDSGKVSQRTLATYVEEAATKPQTVDLYSTVDSQGVRTWDKSRQQLHDRIIQAYLKKRAVDPVSGKPVLDYSPGAEDLAPHPDGPKVLFSGGGYAAGKGGVLKILAARGETPPDSFTLDPDQIKAELPEFQAMIGTDPEANLHVYREAWAIAQEIQARAMEKKLNIVVDGISDTAPEEMGQRANAFTSRGYEARAVYVDIPTEEALKRAANRAENAKDDSDRRMIPEIIMRSVHRDVASTVPQIAGYVQEHNIPLSLEVWDNDQGKDDTGSFRPPKQFYTFDPSAGENVVDQGLWDRFRQKGHETIMPSPGVTA